MLSIPPEFISTSLSPSPSPSPSPFPGGHTGVGSSKSGSSLVRHMREGMAVALQASFSASLAAKAGALPMSGTPGYGGRYGGGLHSFLYGLLPGAKINYQYLAGETWKNSVVAAALGWIGRNLPQAAQVVYRRMGDSQEKPIYDHPVVDLLNQPNPYYDGGVLRFATTLSLICAGSSYTYIVRDNLGRPKELWYLPHFQIRPYWHADATTDDWIEGYLYTQNSKTIPLRNEDVIHFRFGLDPLNPRMGLSDLASAYREIVTVNEKAGYDASLMRNLGIPGVIITPKESTDRWDESTGQAIKTRVEENTQGDNRFRPMVLDGAVNVAPLGLTPEQLLLSTFTDEPVATLCSLIGVNAVVLGLKVGLQHSTFSNNESAERHAWLNGIVPRLALMDKAYTTQLMPFFGDAKRDRVGSDLTKVPALAENEDALFTRVQAAVGGPFLTVNEARRRVGYADIDGGDLIYPPRIAGNALPTMGDDAPDPEKVTPPNPAPSDKPKPSPEDDPEADDAGEDS